MHILDDTPCVAKKGYLTIEISWTYLGQIDIATLFVLFLFLNLNIVKTRGKRPCDFLHHLENGFGWQVWHDINAGALL